MLFDNIEELLEQIKRKRKQMIDLAKNKPLTDSETIKASQELDDLLNEYENLKKKKH